MPEQAAFRKLLYELESERLAPCRGLDPRTFGRIAREHPVAGKIIADWDRLREEPFHGLTCDGSIEKNLYQLADEGAPTAAMVAAATHLLSALTAAQRSKLCYSIDAWQWRHWSNPEFLINDNGLRLEDCDHEIRGAVMGVLSSSMSPAGLAKTLGCFKTNAFLGQLCQLPTIMNEWSYNFLLFGEPSFDGPWGWSIYGHHLALNCFVLGRQIVISPTFMGAEPNLIDDGPDKGLRLFDAEELGGLNLMRSLTKDQRERATAYKQMLDPAMPEGRLALGDERHLGGAFRDNRVVPYEGIKVSEFKLGQKRALMDIFAAFITYLPDKPRAAKLAQIETHLDRTYWSWIGGQGDDDPFYYRVQSPVIMVEFDHHSGVWLNNAAPAKCHIHTVVRTPNGNDYGRDLLRQHYQIVHRDGTSGCQ